MVLAQKSAPLCTGCSDCCAAVHYSPALQADLANCLDDLSAGIKVPSSLNNIYKELAEDVGTTKPNNGCLKKWCSQGVLLLNAVLTLRAGESNSHAGKGWEHFTSAALAALAEQRSGIVVLLWGKYAQARCASLDMRKHHVLSCAHPSGLSVSRGFFGCRHFSQTNKLLVQSGQPPIDWQIDNV